jgi:3-deoxy-D-manno-octulosonic-acid transferase
VFYLLGKRFHEGLAERLGFYRKAKFAALAGTRPIWIHAASVGEVRAASHLARELKRRSPARIIVVSTFTATGNRSAREMSVADLVVFLPLDLLWIVRRALARIDPAVLIIIETEIWPNLLREASRKGIPSLLLSGRLSARAWRKYSWFGGFFRHVVRYFTAIGMQSKQDRERIVRLGAPANRVSIVGNLKHAFRDGQGAPAFENRDPTQPGGNHSDSLWLVAGSSHRGEEEILIEAFMFLKSRFPRLRLVLAPRHPQRFDEVERLLKAAGLLFEKKSQVNGRLDPSTRTPAMAGGQSLGIPPENRGVVLSERSESKGDGSGAPGLLGGLHFQTEVMFVDTLGDLQDFYAAGDVAFVGGSLVDAGGHNLLEPAGFAKPVIFGPHMANFKSLAKEMAARGGGIEVEGKDEFIRAMTILLTDSEKRKSMGKKAFEVAADDHGVLERSFAVAARYLP